MKPIYRLLFAVSIWAALCPTAGADDLPFEFSKEAAEEANTRYKKIKAEAETLGEHPWAGSYYFGDGLGVNISYSIAPEAGFVYEWHGCLGVYGRDYGDVSYSSGTLTMTSAIREDARHFGNDSNKLLLVPWGEKVFLISPEEMIEFCNDVNARANPEDPVRGDHLLRREKEASPFVGLPVVPSAYRAYLLEQPITAKIISVEPGIAVTSKGKKLADKNAGTTRATIDKGASDGVLPGMIFYVLGPENFWDEITIDEVGSTTSRGEIDPYKEERPPPATGTSLSTREP